MIWANSPWSASYERLWTTPVSVNFGSHSLHLLLRELINEGLITIFFFVVGLEIKRELVSGMLAGKRAAFLPVAAAVGGMAAPALIYLAIAGGSTAAFVTVSVTATVCVAPAPDTMIAPLYVPVPSPAVA